jgi:glycolate oxidase
MPNLKKFAGLVLDQFPDDRVTWQKGVATFHPETAEETAILFKLAAVNNQKLYISGFENNIVPVGEKFNEIMAVKTDRMNQLINVVSEDLYIEVGAGYPLREINKNLEKFELFLPHSDLPYVGSVGGALAVGLSLKRDNDPNPVPLSRFFIMAKIATSDGEVISPGSACFKSVSGLDIVKIFSPSWGLLGMIASATFRVLPISARDEYVNPTQQAIDYNSFAETYRNPGDNQSAIYSIKIKNKFDPSGILPLI